MVEHCDTELTRLFKLASRVVAGDDVIGVLRHRAHDLAAPAPDQLYRFVPGHAGECSRKHEGLASGLPVRRSRWRFFGLHANSMPARSQLRDDFPIVLLRKKLLETLHQLRSDTLEHRGKRRLSPSFSRRVLLLDRFLLFCDAGPVGVEQRLQLAKVFRENPGDFFSDSRNSQCVDEAGKSRRL